MRVRCLKAPSSYLVITALAIVGLFFPVKAPAATPNITELSPASGAIVVLVKVNLTTVKHLGTLGDTSSAVLLHKNLDHGLIVRLRTSQRRLPCWIMGSY